MTHIPRTATHTYCSDDVYFTPQDGHRCRSTPRRWTTTSSITDLELTDYMTYNATDEELADYGLDDPELTVQ